jgi:hypothetical protein
MGAFDTNCFSARFILIDDLSLFNPEFLGALQERLVGILTGHRIDHGNATVWHSRLNGCLPELLSKSGFLMATTVLVAEVRRF